MSPFFFKRSKQKRQKLKDYPIIDASLDDVRQAIRKFTDQLPKGTYRTILVNDDYSIDFSQLASFLDGIPSKKFYMSKETYDIFPENENMIPKIMDKVQKAVDQCVEEHGKYPILPFDPYRKVNYSELIQKHYLDSRPEIDFYITDYDGIITHIKPKKTK